MRTRMSRVFGVVLGLSVLSPLSAQAVSGVNDYNGDLVSDLAVFHPAAGKWYITQTNQQVLAWGLSWGFPDGLPVIGDYDADGKADLAIYNQRTGDWYIRTLAGSVLAWKVNWGGIDMTPVPGDYNGDGQWDLALFQRSTGDWYIRTLGGTVLAWKQNWGGATMRPVSGDFDGDGTYDMAAVQLSYDNGSVTEQRWFIRRINGSVIAFNENAGTMVGSRAIPLLADTNGDGIHDRTTYSYAYPWDKYYWTGGRWGNSSYEWGTWQMTPVCGDYDKDLTSDCALWDRTTYKWYIKSRWNFYVTGSTLMYGLQWGGPGMLPVGGPLDYRTSFVIERSSGGIHPWNASLPAYMKTAPGKTPVRVILDPEVRETYDTCRYDGGTVLYRFRYYMNVRLVNHKGATIKASTMYGTTPRSCPWVIFGGGENRYGSRITATDLNNWLANLVATY